MSDVKRHIKAINLMPFGHRTLWGASGEGNFLWLDFIGDTLYALPFGFLLFYCYRYSEKELDIFTAETQRRPAVRMSKTLPERLYHGYWRGKRGALIGALCLGGFSHLSIEVDQVLIASRMSDVNDVLSRLLGTALGAGVFVMICGIQRRGINAKRRGGLR